jgi:mycothiol synthase
VAAVAAVALAAPGDLLVALDAAVRPLGLHWTSRRAHGVGEVFNLAVDPAAHGRGVGRWLLAAGLAHLTRLGRREVVLWVDAANGPALALYQAAGFTPRAHDVALVPVVQSTARDERSPGGTSL